MHVRRLTVAALSLLLPLSAVACGSDDKSDTDTTTTTKAESDSGSGTTAAPSGETTDETTETVVDEVTTTMSPADFDAAIASFNSTLDAAGDDFCKIAEAATTLSIGNPTTADQAKAAIGAFAAVLNRIAETAPADSGIDTATIKDAATRVVADAEASNYDPAALSESGPPALTDPAISTAMAGLSSAIDTTCS